MRSSIAADGFPGSSSSTTAQVHLAVAALAQRRPPDPGDQSTGSQAANLDRHALHLPHPGGRDRARLGTDGDPSEVLRMTSSAFSAIWLPAAITRAAVVTAPPAQRVPTAGRHSTPEVGSVKDSIATETGPPGRHAEPEWSREVFDSLRDEDPLDWLGFSYVD